MVFAIFIPCILFGQQAFGQQPPVPQPAGGAEAAPDVEVKRPRAVLPGEAGSTEDKTIFGVLPNYRTADGSQPFVPITTKQKYTIAEKDSFNYPAYVLAALFSGISQGNNTNPSFGQGIKGYAHRYATAVIDQDLGNMVTEGIMPSFLHDDPRFFRKVHGSGKARILYALTRVFVTRTDSGGSRFNTSEILGNAMVASFANIYYPDSRGFGDTAQRMGTQIATDAISGLLKEFWPDIKRKLDKH